MIFIICVKHFLLPKLALDCIDMTSTLDLFCTDIPALSLYCKDLRLVISSISSQKLKIANTVKISLNTDKMPSFVNYTWIQMRKGGKFLKKLQCCVGVSIVRQFGFIN